MRIHGNFHSTVQRVEKFINGQKVLWQHLKGSLPGVRAAKKRINYLMAEVEHIYVVLSLLTAQARVIRLYEVDCVEKQFALLRQLPFSCQTLAMTQCHMRACDVNMVAK